MSLDLIATSTDVISLVCLLLAAIVGLTAVRAFKQSKQAVAESASLLSVIVDALSSRIQSSESVLARLRSDMMLSTRRTDALENRQGELLSSYERTVQQLENVLANDRKLVVELEQLKTKLGELQRSPRAVEGLPRPENLASVISEGDLLGALTPTERHTLEILRVEGTKGAPELGKRLMKSREHTSRLMKKLYMEGYVSRESNHAPFRYKLNETVRSALESSESQITAEQPEIP